MREAVDRVVDEVLRPLFRADGGDLEVVSLETEQDPVVVIIEVRGAFRGCPGTPSVLEAIVAPAIGRALGRPVRVRPK